MPKPQKLAKQINKKTWIVANKRKKNKGKYVDHTEKQRISNTAEHELQSKETFKS